MLVRTRSTELVVSHTNGGGVSAPTAADEAGVPPHLRHATKVITPLGGRGKESLWQDHAYDVGWSPSTNSAVPTNSGMARCYHQTWENSYYSDKSHRKSGVFGVAGTKRLRTLLVDQHLCRSHKKITQSFLAW